MTKEARLYNGGKIVSSLDGAGKTGKLHVKKKKKEIGTFFNTIHKNKLNMDKRPRFKTGCYIIL